MAIKRVFHNRQPQVGDSVVTIRDSSIGDWKANYEYIITKLGNGYIVANSKRLGYSDRRNGGVAISDGGYRIFEDVYYELEPKKEEKLKETHEYTYRILGIPIFKRTLKIYDEKIICNEETKNQFN